MIGARILFSYRSQEPTVISMARQRRRWTPEQKLTLVVEMGQPGSSLAAMADRYGGSWSLLFD